MASYVELKSLHADSTMLTRIEVATWVAAETILANEDSTDPPWDQGAGSHDLRAQWAATALNASKAMIDEMLSYVLAANKGLSVAGILGATDAAFQNNVNQAVDEIAKARYGV